MDIHEDDLNEIRKDLADMEAEQEAEYDAQYEAYLMEPPTCPICDAWGCGGDGFTSVVTSTKVGERLAILGTSIRFSEFSTSA